MLLASLGANLLLVDKDSVNLDRLSDRICAKGYEEPGVCPLNLALTGPAEFDRLAGILRTKFDGLDVIVHCAAAFQGLQPLDQVAGDQWLECMQVNVNAAWLATMACFPLLKSSGKGRVVFIHDKASASAYWGAYGVSKAALAGLGIILGEECEGTSIKVLNIDPGPIRTALRARAYLAEDPLTVKETAIAAANIIRELRGSFSS